MRRPCTEARLPVFQSVLLLTAVVVVSDRDGWMMMIKRARVDYAYRAHAEVRTAVSVSSNYTAVFYRYLVARSERF